MAPGEYPRLAARTDPLAPPPPDTQLGRQCLSPVLGDHRARTEHGAPGRAAAGAGSPGERRAPGLAGHGCPAPRADSRRHRYRARSPQHAALSQLRKDGHARSAAPPKGRAPPRLRATACGSRPRPTPGASTTGHHARKAPRPQPGRPPGAHGARHARGRRPGGRSSHGCGRILTPRRPGARRQVPVAGPWRDRTPEHQSSGGNVARLGEAWCTQARRAESRRRRDGPRHGSGRLPAVLDADSRRQATGHQAHSAPLPQLRKAGCARGATRTRTQPGGGSRRSRGRLLTPRDPHQLLAPPLPDTPLTAPLSPARKAALCVRSTARALAHCRGGWPLGSAPLPASHGPGPTPGAMATRHQHGTASPGSGSRVRITRHDTREEAKVGRHGCGRLPAPRARGPSRPLASAPPSTKLARRRSPRLRKAGHAQGHGTHGRAAEGAGPAVAVGRCLRLAARNDPWHDRRRASSSGGDVGRAARGGRRACTKRGTQESAAVAAGRRGCGRTPGAAELIDGAVRLVACNGPWRCRCRAT